MRRREREPDRALDSVLEAGRDRGMTRSLFVGVVLVLALAAAPVARALCAMQPPVATRFVGPVQRVVRGAGIVVVQGDRGAISPRLRGGAPLEVEEVAGSLRVVRVPASAALGAARLEGVLESAVGIEVVDEALPPAIAEAPAVTLHRIDEPGPRGTNSRFEARRRGDAPAGAIALVVRWADGSTWVESTSEPTLLLAFVGRCSGRGEMPPRGTRARARWIDAYGRQSPESAPIVVQ